MKSIHMVYNNIPYTTASAITATFVSYQTLQTTRYQTYLVPAVAVGEGDKKFKNKSFVRGVSERAAWVMAEYDEMLMDWLLN